MIEVKNVTKKYGNVIAVNNVSFSIKDGEIVGFLGPNGAGKSTTMNMIVGYIEPTYGSISVNGYDVSKKAEKAKRHIGYMPEGVPLYYDLTVKEFVTYMAKLKKVKRQEVKEKVEKAIKETGLEDVQRKLIRNLSRGYKQRTSLAGALVGDPEVLILDEPTVGLDPKQITEIRNLIKSLGKTHTVILSSHILSEVSQICEKVIIINKGNILAIDTPENLEKKTQGESVILLTVEDEKNKMGDIQKWIPQIKECKLINKNEDGTTQYRIESDESVDIRKKLFEVLAKESITIFELKKSENTLEDAFLALVEDKSNEKDEAEDKEKKTTVKKDKEKGKDKDQDKAKKTDKTNKTKKEKGGNK